MRCIIARFPFDLTKSEVEGAMKGVRPEPVTGESVDIGRRSYPVKQVGEVITGQSRRDFTAAEVVTALVRLGFTCHPAQAPGFTPIEEASALFGHEPATYPGSDDISDPPGITM